ncbi:hypothetical protein OSB04_un000011 [Centaurea solstitialis]|uniref:Uncharacterized protein n=1 Tax=Centaurea solstitialis TaxID=347529 RepID=A0AA38SPC9_9ASTR|nr:hypothetical protein OSB04_un000011 [Centaurea solstitialis]
MDNGFIASLQQQLQEANNEIQRLRALPGPSMSIPMSIPPLYPPQHLRPPPRPQFNASVPFSTVNQQYNNVRPSLPQVPPPIPHGPPPMPRVPPPMPQGAPMFTFEPFNNISQQIPIPGHIPTVASSTVHTTIPPSTGISSSCIPIIPINVEDPLNVRLKSLEEQNQKLFALLTKLPGAAVPVEVEPKTGFQASPFVDELALVDVPKKYTIPAFTTKYSGITDPVEHIAQYKQLMWTVPIPAQYQEVCMCKSFGSTLTGAALQWLINLKPKSIGSFAELVNQFTRQFASSRKMEKQTSDLYYIVQKSGETIRDYFNRFNATMIEIKNCDVKTAIEAYKRGLEDSSGLYVELTKYPPENFDDVRARTLAFMRIEDDALFRRKHSAEKKPLGAQKHDFKHKRVNKIGNPRYESKTRPGKGTSKDLVDSLRKIDANVRWPKKSDKPSKDKDQNRWCNFHDDHDHTTDECISLKKEISYLKSKGHLKGLIPEEQGRPASPVHTKVVNCITGGSELQSDMHEMVQTNILSPEKPNHRDTISKECQRRRVAALTRFISRSSDKCHLFYNVLRKNQGFLWTDEHEKALQELKQYMTSPPLLTKPVEGESLQLYLAVSKNATSAVLVREEDQRQQPIYYVSKSFLDAETRYTSMEKLLLGLMTAAKKLRHYFESHHIIVVTNYPLKTSIYLSGFDIEFKPKTAIKSQVLADFVAEFSPGLEPTTCDEVVMISDNRPWILYVDGSSNVRGCGLGIVLKSSQGGNIVYSVRCEFKATNNEAEYEALIAGLDIALRLGAKQLHVRSDSLLVVNQVNGDFQAKDSKMMSYLKAVKDRIARFEQFLIEQIPRDLNMQADALANLGSAFHDPFMENIPILHLTTPTIAANDEVQMNEEIYNWSLDIWNYLKYDQLPEDKMEARKTRSRASRYTIFEDQLYRRSTTGLLLRCITSKLRINQILQEMHDGECGNHTGGRSLANRISRQGYYWPTLREDAITYVQRCDACQKHSSMVHRPSEPLHSVLVPWPFMRWGMDIVGKLPPAPGQKVYLLVLTDYFSKWIEAGAFSQVRDKEVISFIQKNIIYRFGVPAEIMCDNGSQFISDKTRTFCEKRGIKLITSTPRYPQSNGLAESSNKVIINSIRKRLKGAKGKWVDELPSVLWANRTTPRASTGQTPYSLVYGCEAVLPIEAQIPTAKSRTYDQNAINLSYDLDALEELREKTLRTMAAQKGIVERHFNKKVKAKILQVGDYVLRHVFQNTQEPNAGKLSIKWEGPYIISKVIGNGAYKLTTIEGMEIPRSWNAHHLKRYYF